jgi:hypothetical protein
MAAYEARNEHTRDDDYHAGAYWRWGWSLGSGLTLLEARDGRDTGNFILARKGHGREDG